jgi:hypothetical protein
VRYTLIACEVFYRELCLAIAKTPSTIDVAFLPKGMHNTPAVMRKALQDTIDAVDDRQVDAVLLGFGLCGNVAKDIVARSHSLVIPRTDDCIALFLGGRNRYMVEFTQHPGTYYYSSASFERATDVEGSGALGAEVANKEEKYKEYVERYGEENAKYLIEVELSWSEHYTRAAYLHVPELAHLGYAAKVADKARSLGLEYTAIDTDLSYLQRLLSGNWSTEEFLIVPPGHRIEATYDDRVLKAVLVE